MEIHLAGHTPDPNLGAALLVDSHDAPVAPEVWALYERLIRRIGARPTLIERDDKLPAFAELLAERAARDAVLRAPLRRGRLMNTPVPAPWPVSRTRSRMRCSRHDAAVPPEVAALAAQPAFAVYRNTVMKGCIDALQANYPAVARLVGEEWFRAAAAIYVREALPARSDAARLRSGVRGIPRALRAGRGTAIPLRRRAARPLLDRGARRARRRRARSGRGRRRSRPTRSPRTVLHPHPAARWAWFDDAPIYTIWSRNRADAMPPTTRSNGGRGRAARASARRGRSGIALDAAGCAFLDACAAGGTLAAAARGGARGARRCRSRATAWPRCSRPAPSAA